MLRQIRFGQRGQSGVGLATAVLALFLAASSALGEADDDLATLEGTVTVTYKDGSRGAGVFLLVELVLDGKPIQWTHSDIGLGGFYRLDKVKPGTYEVRVYEPKDTLHKGFKAGMTGNLRPQRLHGVVLKPKVVSTLKVFVKPGDALEEVGKPTVRTEAALIVSEELARLRQEVEALRKEVEQLKKK